MRQHSDLLEFSTWCLRRFRLQVRPLCLPWFWVFSGSACTRSGAVAGMLAGLVITVVYMVLNFPVLRQWFGFSGEHLWFGIQPVSAGVFGVPVGVLVAVIVSLLSPPPNSPDAQGFWLLQLRV